MKCFHRPESHRTGLEGQSGTKIKMAPAISVLQMLQDLSLVCYHPLPQCLQSLFLFKTTLREERDPSPRVLGSVHQIWIWLDSPAEASLCQIFLITALLYEVWWNSW